MVILQAVLDQLEKAKVFQPLGDRRSPLVVADSGFAPALVSLARTLPNSARLCVVVPTDAGANALRDDLLPFQDVVSSSVLGGWDTFAFERVSPRIETMGTRLRGLWLLANRDAMAERREILLLSSRALAQRFNPEWLAYEPIAIATGQTLDLDRLVAKLVKFGYRREYQVESIGEFAVRGSILDLFPSDRNSAVRIDLFGDEVDRLMEFSLSDQRSSDRIESLTIHPAREFRATSAERSHAAGLHSEIPNLEAVFFKISEGEFFEGMESWAPFFPDVSASITSLLRPDDILMMSEPARVTERIGALIEEEEALLKTLGPTWGIDPSDFEPISLFLKPDELLKDLSCDMISRSPLAGGPSEVRLDIDRISLIDRREESIVAAIRADQRSNLTVLVSADSISMANRIIGSLKDAGVAAMAIKDRTQFDSFLAMAQSRRPVGCFISSLEVGFSSSSARLSLYAPFDLTGRRQKKNTQLQSGRAVAALFENLAPGGYVVHDFHGVGRYLQMVRREVAGVERDYLEIEYRDKSKLFLPTDQMGVITPYSGGEKPALSKLGGHEWQKTKAKVKKTVERIAQELVLLYQKRLSARGIPHLEDTPWQSEMEDLFPYSLTKDQVRAISEVKSDMESDRPMDRLICGDVGFGKTEVAIRAAFKAVQSGRQVAILVPTTLLAHQHHLTFSERFAQFPIRVEVVSRFLGAGEVKEVLSGVANGSVDVVIGTHRLLSKDVKFARLGLLVVDEEQRFGVNHKEAVKRLALDVDILTLTATPIPRTLEMSLTGLRDLSLLSTPPGSRQPILTYVGGYDEAAVTEALRRELLREGQVFFVHNRVMDIETVATRLRALVPEARIAVAHGQMEESELERVVDEFWEGRFDVLVCTTIIESGIDMPSVNTLVVDRAEFLGLGQLHQLRGRVGRGATKGYAYLFHSPDTRLTEEAYERLKTIGEAVELGAGFRIAMRDLEIRGAGNLLGQNQSGHIAAVGYDLYVKMVKDAIAYLNGEQVKVAIEVRVDLPVTATIPQSYIAREDLRLEIYKELADCDDDEAIAELLVGLGDRFGPVPFETLELATVTKIRNRAARLKATEVRSQFLGNGPRRRVRLIVTGMYPPASVMVNFQRRFKKVHFHDFSQTLTLETNGPGSPTELALDVLDLVIARANPNSVDAG